MENEQLETSTLKTFGQAFQTKIIHILNTDKAFLERIHDIMDPKFWESNADQWIVKFIMDYFTKYRETPTMGVFSIEIKKITDPVLSLSVKEQMKLAYESATTDLAYVKEKFLTFCKNQKLKNAIFASYEFLQRGDYESIGSIINEATRAGVERNLGHDYQSDIDVRMTAAARSTIKTNWEIIDKHLDGGLGNGELGFIVAPAGSGKSWILTAIGGEAMKQGKNIMHFTMELNEKYVGLRYDAYFSGISFQDVRSNTDVVKEKIKNIKGKLFIKYFPIKTASPATLKMHIERLELITGIKIDMVIIDYADILRPASAERNSNSYSEAGNVYEELRGVLGELQIPGWTASQSNRSAHEEEVIEAHNVADSYRKIMTGDFIISLSRKSTDKVAGTGRFHIMKNRFGADGMTYPCSFDTSCGKINIYDQKSVEGMEILAKTKDAQENVKNTFKKQWNKTHNDSDEE